jgi:hypothetical protein
MKIVQARCLWSFAVISSLVAARAAYAVTVPDLYETSMPVTTSRDAAFVDALRAVAVRVSGQRDAAARLGDAANNPRQYVQRFGFTNDNVLLVGFDSVSVDQLLSDAGLPIWGRERPSTLVLLKVAAADGSSYWIDATGNPAEREALTRAARQRGLPVIWPALTSEDRVQISADAADPAQLRQVAARYNANAVLLGSAHSAGGSNFSVQWTLVDSEAGANISGSLEDGIHLAADTFARVYSASSSTLDSVLIEVGGIGNLNAYASTLNYLEGITLVRGVAVEQVLGDTMKFRLAVRGDAGTLRRALALDGKLVPLGVTEQASVAGDLRFRYQP